MPIRSPAAAIGAFGSALGWPLTGWGQDDDRRRAKEAGFDHHLVKPAEIGALQSLPASMEARNSAGG